MPVNTPILALLLATNLPTWYLNHKAFVKGAIISVSKIKQQSQKYCPVTVRLYAALLIFLLANFGRIQISAAELDKLADDHNILTLASTGNHGHDIDTGNAFTPRNKPNSCYIVAHIL